MLKHELGLHCKQISVNDEFHECNMHNLLVTLNGFCNFKISRVTHILGGSSAEY